MRPRLVVSRRRSPVIVTLTLMASLVLGSVATAPPAAAVTSSEYQLAKYINRSRQRRDIRSLSVSASLSSIARSHSQSMANSGGIFHTSDLGGRLASYSWTTAGENVGRGPTLWSIHLAMKASPSHWSNILLRKYTRMGVGVVWKNGRAYITEMFMG